MVLQIVQILSDMAAAIQVVSVLTDQQFLRCGMLCKFMTCLLCFTKNSSWVFVLSYTTVSLHQLLCFLMVERLRVILTAVPFVLRP